MKSVNPAVIPRNHKVEEALQAGEEGDITPFHNLISALDMPYEDGDHLLPYQAPPQPGEKVLQTFCGTWTEYPKLDRLQPSSRLKVIMFIGIAGIIGAGKSTLAQSLADYLGYDS